MKRTTIIITLIVFALGALSAQAEDDFSNWYESVQIKGLIDARILAYDSFTPDNSEFDDESVSDVYLYWASLAVDAEPTEWARAVFSVLYEQTPPSAVFGTDHMDELGIDEAYVNFHLFWAYFQVGKGYMPFFHYQPLAISDSLPYTLAVTNKTAYEIGLDSEYFAVSFSGFNGSYDIDDGDNVIDDWLARLDVRPLAWLEGYDLELGGAYMNDATETEADLGNALLIANNPYEDNVGIWSAFLNFDLDFSDKVGLAGLFEMASTLEFDEDNYVDRTGEATSIMTYNVELAVKALKSIWIGGKYDSISGVDYLGAERFQDQDTGNYEATSYSRFGGFVNFGDMDKIRTGLEYLDGSDNENNVTQSVTLQFLANY